ncbi:type I restriction-modification protein subunit M [Flavobacterium sp. 316]|uniref:type I restriction-modification system subunit M n=1 Tax=Flavobacterium sp. 316 TaxID=1603293 RepID=UPI0005DE48F2|nr:type I restriction-modification system subunit M [Flavobacterium sp. 316]KIX20724.1 type I restriction-modification protein subunit M [Flavobacterium sp. 316]
MNKQQLAAKIWESANQMRSKIEANEYKDYILGFIFYKYLSDKEIQFCKKADFTEEDIKALSEEDEETVNYIKKNIGYFIAYDDLFTTWIDLGKDFSVDNVRTGLSAFNRLISPAHKKLFDEIFDTLQTGLSKLGDTAPKQTKAISDLLHLIKDIPMDSKQGYDVLGFIYEYLIEKFAANAGKKAGEFYTPHEVSVLLSEIVSNHLKDRKEIQIYDSCSGSGSLLINIGNSVAKHIDDKNNIKYYAQELKKNTYNLTRMNLVMRDILPNNIVTRNGDTLEDDWPYFDENDAVQTYNTLYVDAVVSNPPYSQKWDPTNKDSDPRYSRFGLAPKSKADFAFLLHDLFHIKPDGIMTIVLPHGVLFRGGEEGTIRKRLIEANHIDTIIGLPPSIFFGTGIPTVVIVLKQKRVNTDVLIIDASKGFIKEGKNNKLRASDIKKIADIIRDRQTKPKFSKVVERDYIRENEYNLNIPRYVDSSENPESWDIYASMFGGIPVKEIDELEKYWQAFPNLREALFSKTSEVNAELKVKEINNAIKEQASVKVFKEKFDTSFSDLDTYLKQELLTNMETVNVPREKTVLSNDIFKRLETIDLIDKYEAYQLLDNEWEAIKIDLEIIQTEGFESAKVVEPNMVMKKKDGKDVEVQEGWKGRIMPFELVQKTYLKEELDSLQKKENRLLEIASEYEEIIDSLSEEEKDSPVLNDSNDAFVTKEVGLALQDIFADVESEEINTLKTYLDLLVNKAKKPEKIDFINTNKQVQWAKIEASKDGTFSKANVNKHLFALQSTFTFPEDSYESKIVKTGKLLEEEKELKKLVKVEKAKLHLATKYTIENLPNEQVYELLELKWVQPIVTSLNNLPKTIIDELTSRIIKLSEKYSTTYSDVAKEIKVAENSLSKLIEDLTGNEFDMKGLNELKVLLNSEN